MSSTASPPVQLGERSLERQILGVAGYVGALRPGPRAVLRRLSADPAVIPPQPFWDVVERYDIHSREETFWLGVIPLMVRHAQRNEIKPGAALARAGLSAARLERWLRLDGGSALREAPRLLSHLRDGGLDWSRFGRLLHDWDHAEYGPRRRRDLARDFFLSPEFRARTATGE